VLIVPGPVSLSITGGKALQAKLRELAGRLGTGGDVSVGFFEGAVYPADAEKGSAGLPVAQVALWNEFGTSNAPARPFFRTMIALKSPSWGNALAINAKSTHYNTRQTLTLMGEGIQDQLVTSINEWNSPPNADYTVKRKGFDKPLIDTKRMRDSVGYVVSGLDE
jgi:hypothetical protein